MSVQSEISRISGNISDSLDAVASKGVDVPAGANSDSLAGLIRSISAGIEIVKIWQNASPSSSFPAQTVPLDLSSYAFLFIEMKYRNDITSGALFTAAIGKKFAARQASAISVANPDFSSRFIEAKTNGVVFSEGYNQSPSMSTRVIPSPTYENAYAIPTIIYGVKGVS